MSSTSHTSILYSLKGDWGLPSLSIACIQAEAYLRLAKVDFVIQNCNWCSFSPTGQIPALDTQDGTLIGSEGYSDYIPEEFSNSKAIISHIKKQKTNDLDSGLSRLQHSEVLAFTILVESKLIPALLYSTWGESDAYSRFTRPAFGSGLDFPLNRWLPFAAYRSIHKHIPSSGEARDQIYIEANEVLEALASRIDLEAHEGIFFLGNRACSLDALLYATLAYIQSSPVIHPLIKDTFKRNPILKKYVDAIAAQYFSTRIPTAAETELQWSKVKPRSASGTTHRQSSSARSTKTARELEIEKKGRMWLIFAGSAIVGYLLFSGQYIEVQQFIQDLGEDDDGEEF